MIATIVPSSRAWELLYLLTRRDLKLRYQDTALGFLWSMLSPLAFGAVLYVALGKFVRIDVENYHLVLLAALFPWIWFQNSVFLGTGSFAGNRELIKKVLFPRFVLPFSLVINNGILFLLTIPVYIVLLGVSGDAPGIEWVLGVPMLVVVQLGLLMGTILILASVDVFFRDLEHLVEIMLRMLFYATPILYPLHLVPDRWKPVLLINPMASLVESWRELLLDNTLPGLDLWPALVYTVLVLPIGFAVFRRLERGFADAL